MLDLRRRQFVTLLGGLAAAWPLGVGAQQAPGVRRVAFLHPYAEKDPEVLARVLAFREGLAALGWTENRNIRILERRVLGRLRLPWPCETRTSTWRSFATVSSGL
jgi:hypothetical protein